MRLVSMGRGRDGEIGWSLDENYDGVSEVFWLPSRLPADLLHARSVEVKGRSGIIQHSACTRDKEFIEVVSNLVLYDVLEGLNFDGYMALDVEARATSLCPLDGV